MHPEKLTGLTRVCARPAITATSCPGFCALPRTWGEEEAGDVVSSCIICDVDDPDQPPPAVCAGCWDAVPVTVIIKTFNKHQLEQLTEAEALVRSEGKAAARHDRVAC